MKCRQILGGFASIYSPLWKYIATQAYLKKQEKFQIHTLTLYLKELEKKQQMEPKASRRWEVIKITAEINNVETNKPSRRDP